MDKIQLRAPDDWHCHLREGVALSVTVAHQASQFKRSIVMPNLQTPVTSLDLLKAYRDQILLAVPEGLDFLPLMTLYLNTSVSVDELVLAKESGMLHAVKFYPRGATTRSENGVLSWKSVESQLKVMEELDIVLAIHGEVVDPEVDVFARESVFLTRQLAPILERFPRLRVVLEHVSTADAVRFVESAGERCAATITPHHLLLNRNDLLVGGIQPHHYCLPIVKTREDQTALISAALSGHPRFFLGTDSAPHAQNKKESACGCAGIYSACAALEYYAEVFSQHSAMDRLNDFSSVFGAQFYGLELNSVNVQLERRDWVVPERIAYGEQWLIPLWAGRKLQWKKVDENG
jgi:dihydroorotase